MKYRKIIIIVIFILLALLVSFFVYNNYFNKKSDENVINIDDNSNSNNNNNNNSNNSNNNNSNNNSSNGTSSNTNGNINPNTNTNGIQPSDVPSNPNSGGSYNPTPDVVTPEPVTDEPLDERTGEFIVSDNNGKWNTETKLKAFNVDKISPGDNGEYDFVVNNNTNRYIKYTISFDEINRYNANIRYKLKRNGLYVAGGETTYVRYDELFTSDKELNINEKDNYTLYWKWVDAPNDTEVGHAASMFDDVTYTLKVSINSMELDGIDVEINPFTGDKIIKYIVLFVSSILGIIVILAIRKKRNKKEYESN